MVFDERYSSTSFTTDPGNFFDLPFAGIATFMKARLRPSLDDLRPGDADVAVLGFPYDLGTSARSGARMAPRAVRDASTVYADGLRGLYDPVLDEMFLDEGQIIVDCGDVDVSPCGSDQAFRNLEAAVRKVLDLGAVPVVIGGDHATPIPSPSSVLWTASATCAWCRWTLTWIGRTVTVNFGRVTARPCGGPRRCRISLHGAVRPARARQFGTDRLRRCAPVG